MLNFNQLRAFYEVAKTQNVREASKKLFVSQPAVSNQIKSFEESCGLSLFKRQGKRLVITDIGLMLLNQCHILFDLEKNIEKDIQGLHKLKIGVLKVGTSKAFAQHIIARHISRFHFLYPNITFALDEGSSKEIGKSLLRFENELAIIAEVTDLNNVEFIFLFKEKIMLFAPTGHPLVAKKKGIRFHELKGQPIVMRDKGSGTRYVVEQAFSRHGLTAHTLLETGNVDCIKQMVDQGECVAFLAEIALAEELKNKRFQMIPIIDEELNLEVKIGYVKGQQLSPAAKAFLKLVVEDSKEYRSFQHVNGK